VNQSQGADEGVVLEVQVILLQLRSGKLTLVNERFATQRADVKIVVGLGEQLVNCPVGVFAEHHKGPLQRHGFTFVLM